MKSPTAPNAVASPAFRPVSCRVGSFRPRSGGRCFPGETSEHPRTGEAPSLRQGAGSQLTVTGFPAGIFWQLFSREAPRSSPNPPFSPRISAGRTSTKPALALQPPTAGTVEEGGWPGTRMGIGVKSPPKRAGAGFNGARWTDLARGFPRVFLGQARQVGKKSLWDEISPSLELFR